MGIMNFTNDRKKSGFGTGFPGFASGRRGTVSSGNWDKDRKPNRTDCNALDWRKQDGGEPMRNTYTTKGYTTTVSNAQGIIDESYDEYDQAESNMSVFTRRGRTRKCASCGENLAPGQKSNFCKQCLGKGGSWL